MYIFIYSNYVTIYMVSHAHTKDIFLKSTVTDCPKTPFSSLEHEPLLAVSDVSGLA